MSQEPQSNSLCRYVTSPTGSHVVDSLSDADHSARVRARDPWEFAVELTTLLVFSSVTELRTLVCDGVIEHAQEILPSNGTRRKFRQLDSLAFPPGTCFILRAESRTNLVIANSFAVHDGPRSVSSESPPATKGQRAPCWDRVTRRLLLGEQVIKHYRVPAPCQESILDAFEEEAWPTYIDDPLPPVAGLGVKSRLHSTINKLNKHHRVPLIRFVGNGNGNGIGWVWVKTPPEPNADSLRPRRLRSASRHQTVSRSAPQKC